MTQTHDDKVYDTQAEAILRAMIEVAEDSGGTLSLHDPDCGALKSRCTCKPLVLSVPPEMPESL